VSQTTTLILTPTLAPHIANYAFAAHALELQAYQNGEYRPGFTFSLPMTLTVHYSQPDIRLVTEEDQLLFHRWDGAGWSDAANTCETTLPYDRDLEDHVLTLSICRTSIIALYGPTHQFHLPLIRRSY
jgi:hypothetical protein